MSLSPQWARRPKMRSRGSCACVSLSRISADFRIFSEKFQFFVPMQVIYFFCHYEAWIVKTAEELVYFFIANITPSPTLIKLQKTRGSFPTFSFILRMAMVLFSWFEGSATLPSHNILSKTIKPPGLRTSRDVRKSIRIGTWAASGLTHNSHRSLSYQHR